MIIVDMCIVSHFAPMLIIIQNLKTIKSIFLFVFYHYHIYKTIQS